MSNWDWYLNRLRRMSAPEIAHRIAEEGRKRLDRNRSWEWRQFGRYHGHVIGLEAPLVLADDELRARVAGERRGSFVFLGQTWPEPSRGWRSDIWHLDPVTNQPWPGKRAFTFQVPYRHARDRGDVKFVWEVNRLQFLPRMAALAAATQDDSLWAEIAGLLRCWMAEDSPFTGINWNNGIEMAVRIVSLLTVLGQAPAEFRDALLQDARQFLHAHVFWLKRYPSRYSSANNHRVAELGGLFLASLHAPDMPGAATLAAESWQELQEEISRQYYPDGVGAEQSPTYAAFSLEWFLLCGFAARRFGVKAAPVFDSRLQAARDCLAWFMDDAGHLPRIGDDDEGRALAFHPAAPADYVRSVVGMANSYFGDAPQVGGGARCFPDGGYTAVRLPTPEGTLLGIMDHGPLGFLSIAAHGHADALSVWLRWGDEPVLVDAGTYLYHSGGAWRDILRGTSVHNTVAIEGADQSDIAGPFNWSRHAACSLVARSDTFVTAEHDGYLKKFGVRHRRTLRWGDGSFAIADKTLGSGASDLRWSLGFTLAPGIDVTLEGSSVHLVTPGGRKLLITHNQDGTDWKISDAPYSAQFNHLTQTKRLVLEGRLGQGLDCEVIICAA